MKILVKHLFVLGLLVCLAGCGRSTTYFGGQVCNYPHEQISYYKVSEGELQLVEVQYLKSDSTFNFDFTECEDGFYYLGIDDRSESVFAEVYLRNGEKANVIVDNMSIIPESLPDTLIGRWQSKWSEIINESNSMFLGEGRDSDQLERVINTIDKRYLSYMDRVHTSDSGFNVLMKQKAEVEYEFFWLRMFSMASGEESQIMLQQKPFKRMLDKTFVTAGILKVNLGSRFLSFYPSYVRRIKNQLSTDRFDYSMNLYQNDSLKGHMLKEHLIKGKKSGKDFEYLMDKYGQCLTTALQISEVDSYKKQIVKFAEGMPAIDFSYSDALGKQHALSDYLGKVVLVDVWATWCIPCKAEMPHLEKLIEHYQGNPDIVFMGVSVDKQKDMSKWETFVKEHGLKGVQLLADKEFKSQIMIDYEITGVPRFMLFDKEGKIVSVNSARPSTAKLREMIDELL